MKQIANEHAPPINNETANTRAYVRIELSCLNRMILRRPQIKKGSAAVAYASKFDVIADTSYNTQKTTNT